MDLDLLKLFELRSVYIKVFGREKLLDSLEQKISKDAHICDIIDYYTDELGEDYCKNYLISELDKYNRSRFTAQTKQFIKANYLDSLKLLYLSNSDNMDINTPNELLNQKNKKEIYGNILANSQIDTNVKPLLFILKTLSKPEPVINATGLVLFQQTKYFVLEPTQMFQPSEHTTVYRDKQEFLSDINQLIYGLDDNTTNGYFNVGLLTTQDDKTTPPKQNLTNSLETIAYYNKKAA